MSSHSLALSNGAQMPIIGLGTWSVTDLDQFRVALRVALDAGYRHIDTADAYGNEHVIGEVLEEYFKAGKLKREEVFVTTKVPFDAMEPADTEKCILKELGDLRLDYIDLYLIHFPAAARRKPEGKLLTKDSFENLDNIDHVATWRAMEKFVKSGHLRAIGLSNFNVAQLQNVYDHAEIKPAVLQVECHIFWPQHELFDLCKKLGIVFTAYSPIGSPGRKIFRPEVTWGDGDALKEPVVEDLAKKYGRSPAQILLRHLIQRGIIVIPKSTNPDRIKQNFDVFGFELGESDQQKLFDVKFRSRLFQFRHCEGNRNYPFGDVDFSTKHEE